MTKNIEKKDFNSLSKEFSWIINTALGAARIKKLIVEEPIKSYSMRPVLHIILRGNIGSIKSTILNQIAGDLGVKHQPLLEISRPGLVGTIDQKTMQIIPGSAWECRNSLLLVDEVSFSSKNNSYDAFLQLLEDQNYHKKFGVYSTSHEFIDKDLYLSVSSGTIKMKTRFSCIMATMKKFEFMHGQKFRALVSRTVPYSFDLSFEQLQLISDGYDLFRLNIPSTSEESTIDAKTYRAIKKQVVKELNPVKDQNIKKEIYLRGLGDCCRVCAVYNKISKAEIQKIIGWKVDAHSLLGKYYKEAM